MRCWRRMWKERVWLKQTSVTVMMIIVLLWFGLTHFTACMLYYCNTVEWAWWDWGLIWWLTILLQCFDTVGWVTLPVKISSPNDLYCVEWDVKPYSTQLNVILFEIRSNIYKVIVFTRFWGHCLLWPWYMTFWPNHCVLGPDTYITKF